MPTPDLAFSRAKISADGDRSGEHFDTSRRAVMRATTRAPSRPPSRLRRSSVDARDDARARASSSSSSSSSEGRHRISARDASFGAGERDAGDDARAATRDDCAMMEDDARTYETDDSDGSDTVTALIERTTETEKITRDYCATEDSARERTGREKEKPPDGPHCALCRKTFTSEAQRVEHAAGKWHKARVAGTLAPSTRPYT